MNDKLNIEELFKSKLEEMEYTPSPKVWKQTSRALRRDAFGRFNMRRFNIYHIVGLVLLGSVIGVAVSDKKVVGERKEALGVKEEALGVRHEVLGSSEFDVGENSGQNNLGVAEEQQKNISIEQDENSTEQKQASVNQNQASKAEPVSPSPTPQVTQSNDKANGIIKEVSTLIAFFTPSVYEGCAPLEVEFINSSINAETYAWSFETDLKTVQGTGYRVQGTGDGVQGTGYEVQGTGYRVQGTGSQSYVYNEPGTYTVTLSATNGDGVQLSHTEQITVHPSPTADFEIEDGSIYNYSSGADLYKWELLREGSQRSREETQSFSSDFQPDLEATTRSTLNATNLRLIASNAFGCADTALQILPLSPSPSLRFPNVFSPNPNGTTGGFYNLNEPNNQVFYPKYREEPTTYKLQIFNKTGELIFETSDIKIGWDGYYKEAPTAQGVYIYQCTGTWKNGDPYNYRGDITILWTEN